MADGANVLANLRRFAGFQRNRPVVSKLLRLKHPVQHRGRADLLERTLDTVIADEGRENLGTSRVETFRIVCKRRDVLVGPDAVPPLVFVHRAERHEELGAEELGHARDAPAGRGPLLVRRLNAAAVLVKEIKHVRVAVPGQRKQKRRLIAAHNLLDKVAPAVVDCVILVDDQRAAEVNQQQRILIHVRDTQDLDVR